MAMPIVPWKGERRLAGVLIPRLPPHTCYVEMFAGAAALFFMRLAAEVEVFDDVNDALINLCRVVQHHIEEFVRHFKCALSSREVLRWLNNTPPRCLPTSIAAARFYYLQHNCVGGGEEGRTSGVATTSPAGLNLLPLEETLSAASPRLSGA